MKTDRPLLTPYSLRGRLLLGLVPALVTIAAIGFAGAHIVATRTTDAAFDHGTATDVVTLAAQVEVDANGVLTLDLPAPAEEILRTDPLDEEFFSVRGPNGELLGGDADLRAEDVPPGPPLVTAEDFRGRPVHKASYRLATAAGPVMLAFAETTVKRRQAHSDFLLASILPNLSVLLVTIFAVFISVGRGLGPLDRLGAMIRGRRVDDFSALDAETVPLEARPLVEAMNRLLVGLTAASTAQRAFLADAAHQMRTPLTALSTQMELLIDGLPPSERGRAENLQSSLKRLIHLVRQLLALARSAADANVDRPAEPVDLASVAEDAASEWYDRAEAKAVEIVFDLEPGPILGRRWLLRELIANLFDNALRHAPTGGHVGVSVRTDGDRVRLEVSDDGPGVPEGEREAIFRRFYRGPGARDEGTGLGLAIVAEIARLHEATIEVGHAEGAVFRVFFPVHRP
ncbi:sensor histidine kinase [Siculibacillus lacustris]|uniref:histidine kinase n=1 Tax=Siculibacillus lacustris TaxID=1549641 RepID=A0A4Q9VXZ6_9HYPH|nr:sensor histidine kinase [Siculibacillus lacustris]TBW41372.1 sensor histidine kinase [Siculibacillus lacustris]